MIVCPRCQHHNPESASRCAACGGSLAQAVYRACPTCSALNPMRNAYCHRCFSLLDAGLQAELEQTPPPPRVAPRPSVTSARPTPPTTRPPASPPPRAPEPRGAEPAAPELEMPPPPVVGPPPQVGPAPQVRPAPQLPYVEHDPLHLPGALPLEPPIVAPQRAAPLPLAVPTDAERRAADLFYRIATEHAPLRENTVEVVPRRRSLLGRLGRRILYLLVLAAAVAPRLTGGLSAEMVRPRPAVEALAGALDALPAEEPVLISLDYAPAFSGEMDPLALALAGTLAERGVPMLLMSTHPAGVGLAQALVAEIEEEGRTLEYGTDYVLLGFLPGQPGGLRALAGGWAETFPEDAVLGRQVTRFPALAGLGGPTDVADVYVLADDALVARQWVEQVQSRLALRLHALTAARLEPALTPYYESGQLSSLVAGVAGAAELERALDRPGRALGLVDGLLALAALLGLVALAANVIPALRAPRDGQP
jgi:ribosomal protein L40E